MEIKKAIAEYSKVLNSLGSCLIPTNDDGYWEINVLFENSNKMEDETQFDIKPCKFDYGVGKCRELEELWKDFCKENGFRQNSVLKIYFPCIEELSVAGKKASCSESASVCENESVLELTKRLSVEITPEEIEYMDSSQLRERLGEEYADWDADRCYELLKEVRREQRREQHEKFTVEAILSDVPWAAQQAMQKVVEELLKMARKELLFKCHDASDILVNIFWEMFYCAGIDVKNSATQMCEQSKGYSGEERRNNRILYDYCDILRDRMWKRGEVLHVRQQERD